MWLRFVQQTKVGGSLDMAIFRLGEFSNIPAYTSFEDSRADSSIRPEMSNIFEMLGGWNLTAEGWTRLVDIG
jgi:hypothetical protein